MHKLSSAWRNWTRSAGFSAIIIIAATIAVILPAAIQVTQQDGPPTTLAQR